MRGEEWGEGLQGTVITFTPEQNELSDHSVRVRTKRVYMIVEAEGNSTSSFVGCATTQPLARGDGASQGVIVTE